MRNKPTKHAHDDALPRALQHRPNDADQLMQLDVPLEKCGSLIMVMTPWEMPVPLTRVWCLYEIAKAVKYNAAIQMVFLSRERGAFFEALNNRFDEVSAVFQSISVADAEATVEADKYEIFRLIQTQFGSRLEVERICEELGQWHALIRC